MNNFSLIVMGAMRTYKTVTIIVLTLLLGCGCVSLSKKPKPSDETSPARQYIIQGEAFEREDLMLDALEQYRLALSADPGNEEALLSEKRVIALLWEKADPHYVKALELEDRGQYESAKAEYLNALQNWPEHEEAIKRLAFLEEKMKEPNYILHTLVYGDNISKLAQVYYDDFRKHTIISEFNELKDATKIREGQKLKIPVIGEFSLADLKDRQEEYLNERQSKQTVPAPAKTDEEIKPAADEAGKEPVLAGPTPEEPVEPHQSPVDEIIQETLLPPAKDDPYVQGMDLFNQKKFTAAIPLFLEAAKENPDNPAPRDYLFKSHFQQALALFNSEDYLSAKENFESARKYDQNCEKCSEYIEKCETTYKEKHYNLGIHYFGKEQLKKAIEEWERVKQIDPDYKDLAANLQKAETLLKRLESIKQGKSE